MSQFYCDQSKLTLLIFLSLFLFFHRQRTTESPFSNQSLPPLLAPSLSSILILTPPPFPVIFGLIALWAIIEGSITSFLVARYNSNNSYPNNSFRDRLKFTVFVSWWTVVFSIAYLVFFQLGSGGVISSVASHGIWLFVT